jgi:hypothetical protein
MRRVASTTKKTQSGARGIGPRNKLNNEYQVALGRHYRTKQYAPKELEEKYKADAAQMDEEHHRENERDRARQRAERDRAEADRCSISTAIWAGGYR